MAKNYIDDSPLHIAGAGHVLWAPVGTEMFSLDSFVFGDDTTHSGWKWLGDAAADSPVELKTDGDEAEVKSTWDRPAASTTPAKVTASGTLKMNGFTKETLQKAFPKGEWDENLKAFHGDISGASSEVALAIITEDANNIAGLVFHRVSMSGSLPNFEAKEFQTWEINFNVLSPTGGKRSYTWYEPRAFKAKAKPSVGG